MTNHRHPRPTGVPRTHATGSSAGSLGGSEARAGGAWCVNPERLRELEALADEERAAIMEYEAQHEQIHGRR